MEGADALSRLPCQTTPTPGVLPTPCVAMASLLASFRIQHSDLLAIQPYREVCALVLQLNNPLVPLFLFRDQFHNGNLLSLIQTSPISGLSAALSRKLKWMASNFKWKSGMLFFRKQFEDAWLWVPILAQRPTFVARAHLLGHFGQKSTVIWLLQGFKVWWPAIQEDVARCIACIISLPSAPIHHPAIALPIYQVSFTAWQ